MRETRLDVCVLREKDVRAGTERDVRTRRTRDGSEAFIRVGTLESDIDRRIRFGVGHKREGMKERTRVSRVYERKRRSEGGEKTADVKGGKEEGGTKRTNSKESNNSSTTSRGIDEEILTS